MRDITLQAAEQWALAFGIVPMWERWFEALVPAPASGPAMRTCTFSIPGHRSGKISDGELHDAGTWSWLLDQLCAEQDKGWTVPKCLPAKGGGREFRVTIPASHFRRLHNILQEACERFHQESIPVVMEVRHP
jgi:hypothetical protein